MGIVVYLNCNKKRPRYKKSNEDAHIKFMKAAFSILENFPKHFADSQ